MMMQIVPNSPPTAAEQAAATKKGIARFADLNVALAAGYRATTPIRGASVHYSNPAYKDDVHVLDPTQPQTLVYANTAHGPVLLGAMYEMPKPGEAGPDIGGSITRWHFHTGVCFSPLKPLVAGFVSPFGTCPSGAINVVTPAMMHVWIVDIPGGPFSELSADEIAKIASK